jgi:hypothetical protein
MNTFKKALLTSSIGLALSLGAGQAHAVVIDLSGAGPLSMKFDFYSAECITDATNSNNCYGGATAGTPWPGEAGATYPVAVPPDLPFPLPAGIAPGGGTLNETTYGVGRITSISSEPGSFPTLWNNGDLGKQLAVFVYGVADQLISYDSTSGDFTINNVGCKDNNAVGGCDGLIHMDIYEMDTADYLGVVDAPFNGNDAWNATADRTGFNVFDRLTNAASAELWAATTFTPKGRGIDTFNLYSMVQTTRSSTLPTSGSGVWLADCVDGAAGGPACAYLDSNGQANGSDLFGQFTLQTAASAAQANGWDGYNNDPILGTAIPEPGMLSLFGGGLLGMGFFRRFAKRHG